VKPRPNREAEPGNSFLDGLRAADGSGRTVERGEESIACRVYLCPSVTGQQTSNGCVMLLEQFTPSAVS
jgi:hypothetical protein